MKFADAQYAHDSATDEYRFGGSDAEHARCDSCQRNPASFLALSGEAQCDACAGALMLSDVRDIIDHAATELRDEHYWTEAAQLFTIDVRFALAGAEWYAASLARFAKNENMTKVRSCVAMFETLAELQGVFDGLHKLLTDVVDTDAVELRPLAKADAVRDFDLMTARSA